MPRAVSTVIMSAAAVVAALSVVAFGAEPVFESQPWVNETNPSVLKGGLSYYVAQLFNPEYIKDINGENLYTALTHACGDYQTRCNSSINDSYDRQHAYPETVCEFCSEKIQVKKMVVTDVTNKTFTKQSLVNRRISVPDFNGCGSAYVCLPGPCAVFDYDYQAGWHFEEMADPSPDARNLIMYGEGRCGPVFGVQRTTTKTHSLYPETVLAETASIFPSSTSDPTYLYAWDPDIPQNTYPQGYVPTRAANKNNSNPISYYTSVRAWELALHGPSYVHYDDTCYATNSAAPKLPLQLSAPKSFTYKLRGKPVYENVQTFFHYNSMNFSDPKIWNNLIPQLTESNNMTHTGVYQDHHETCDLTVCAWVPIYNEDKKKSISLNFGFSGTMLKDMLMLLHWTLPSNDGVKFPQTYVHNISYAYLNNNGKSDELLNGTSKYPTAWNFTEIWNNLDGGMPLQYQEQSMKCVSRAMLKQNIKNTVRNFQPPPTGDHCLPGLSIGFNDANEEGVHTHPCNKVYPDRPLRNRDQIPQQVCSDWGPNAYNPTVHQSSWNSLVPGGLQWGCPRARGYEIEARAYPYNMQFMSRADYSANYCASKSAGADTNVCSNANKHASKSKLDLEPKPLVPLSEYDGRTDVPFAKAMTLNASFLNSQIVSLSAACDCGKVMPRYAVLKLPWDKLDNTVYNNVTWVTTHSENNGISTVMTEMSYGWGRAVGDMRGELPVGMYIPSTPMHSLNFTIHERDFLHGTSDANNKILLNLTYTAFQSPTQDTLDETLLFRATGANEGTPYAWHTHTFRYGSCMRWPYGQVAKMEMAPDLQAQYFPEKDCDNGNCYIQEEALLGYCENMAPPETNLPPQYPFCARDPFTIGQRRALCTNDRTQYVVVGKTLGLRSPGNICSPTSKVCLVIPDEPEYSMNALLNGNQFDSLENYTLMVTPFNWSTASGFMAPGRGKYRVGNSTSTRNLRITNLTDTDKHLTGMQALSADEFNIFLDPPSESETAKHIASIVVKLSEAYNATTETYDLPFVFDVPVLNNNTLYPPVTESGIFVTSSDIKIRSALPNHVLQFASDPNTLGTCTRFFVSGSGFQLPTPGIHADQQNCQITLAPLELTPVVFGGDDVTKADIMVNVTKCTECTIAAVAFAGHYNKFKLVDEVNANGVIVRLVTGNATNYSVAAARTIGNLTVMGTDLQPAVVQPIKRYSINITPVDVIDLSKYTSVFGSTIMEAEYPLMIPHDSLHLVLFGVLVGVNALAVLVLARRMYTNYRI